MIDSDEIKQRIDIVEYISRYTPLKKAGKQYKGLCPFHTEKTPSFYVYPDDGSWHCYGACATGGDVISFLMKKESLTFVEAIRILGTEAGIDVDQMMGHGPSSRRESLYDINKAAAEYFRSVLLNSPQAQAGRAYLQRRGIDEETAQTFEIGFAPESWSSLRDYMNERGYDHDQQLEAGLVKRHEEKGSIYDAFRNRVIVPIRDARARIIGFGGRVLDDSQPKYLNTAETPVFHKSRVVFGIDMAYEAIRDADRAVIVEGYMDVIAAHQFGYKNVVACMGTSLTAEQLQQIQRYSKTFVFALDSDSAGQQATIRGLNQAREALGRTSKPVASAHGLDFQQRLNAELLIASMPDGMDPDDVIRRDVSQWQSLIENAQPFVDFFMQAVSDNVDVHTAGGKKDAVTALAPLIAELSDDIERQHYVQQLSRMVEIDEMTIMARVQAASKTRSVSQRDRNRKRPKHRRGESQNASQGAAKRTSVIRRKQTSMSIGALEQEDYLLANLLMQPETIYWLTNEAHERNIAPPVAEDWIRIENQEIYRAIKQYLAGDEQWDNELFQHRLDSALHGRLAKLMAFANHLPHIDDDDEVRSDLLKVLVRMRIEKLKNDNIAMKFILADAQQAGDSAGLRSLGATNNRNLKELNHLQSTLADLARAIVQQRRTHTGWSMGYR